MAKKRGRPPGSEFSIDLVNHLVDDSARLLRFMSESAEIMKKSDIHSVALPYSQRLEFFDKAWTFALSLHSSVGAAQRAKLGDEK